MKSQGLVIEYDAMKDHMTDKQLCPCSALDWRDCDMRLEHHPDCAEKFKSVSHEEIFTFFDSLGAISNVQVFDHALSADEIKGTYSETVQADKPLAYWRLDEKPNPSAADSSGDERDGTFPDQSRHYFHYPAYPNHLAYSIEMRCQACSQPFTAHGWIEKQPSKEIHIRAACPYCRMPHVIKENKA